VAKLSDVPEEDLFKRIERGKNVLFAAREKRVKPARDEKILVAWNGLMLKSFAEAAQGLDREDYRVAAVRCAEFLLNRLEVAGLLLHVFKDGQPRIPGYLDDYACLVDGLLSLYESTFDLRWLGEATRLAALMVDHFQDPDSIGFFMTSRMHESLINRPRDFFDNATPSGNSVAVLALLRLAKFTVDESWERRAWPILKAMAQVTAHQPAAFGNLLCALDFSLAAGPEIAIAGNPEEEATRRLLREVFHRYLPNRVVACGNVAEVRLLDNRPQVSDLPTAYVCRHRVCQTPVTSPEDLAVQLYIAT
jgi:uncharacterized protein YyaL (SSP411 family)